MPESTIMGGKGHHLIKSSTGRNQSTKFRISIFVASLSIVSLLVPLDSVYGTSITFVFPTTPSDGILSSDACSPAACTIQIAVSGTNVSLLWQSADLIQFAGSSDNGDTFNTQTIGNANNFGNPVFPQIASSNGNTYAVWRDAVSIKFNEAASFSSAAVQLTTNTQLGFTPQVAAPPGSDDVYVAWTDAGTKEILFRGSNDKGQTFDSGIGKHLGDTDNFAKAFPQITAAGNSVNVAWSNQVDISLSTSTNKGTSFGVKEKVIDDSDTAVTGLQITSIDNNVYVVWQQDNEIKFSRSSDNGVTFSTPQSIGGGTSFALPQIASAGNNVYLTWQNGQTIQFAKSSDNGLNFTIQEIDDDVGTALAVSPQIDVSGGNTNVAVVWKDVTGDVGGDIFAKVSTDSGANFSPASVVGDESSSQISKDPVVGILETRVFAAWQEISSPFIKIGEIVGIQVEFEFDEYKIGDTAKLTVIDPDNPGAGIIAVDVSSTSDPGFSITLDEDPLNLGTFEGTITFVKGPSNQASRELHAETDITSDVITATFGTSTGTTKIFPIEMKLVTNGGVLNPLFGYDYSDIANFEINDPNANTDSGVAETITIDVTSSFGTISLPLKEFGTDSGIFREDTTKSDGSLAELIFMSGNNLIPATGDITITYDFSTNCDASICNPAVIDTIKVDVTSTSDPAGFTLDLVETDIDTKIFQGTFSTTGDPSSGTSIQVKLGDFVVVDTQISGVISDNFFVTTGPSTNVIGSRGGIQVAIPNGDTNMSVSYNPQVDFRVDDNIGAGGGGGGLVRAGLVVNALGFVKTSGFFGGGGGLGPSAPTITSSTLSLESEPSFTQLGQGFSFGGVTKVIDLSDSSGPISIQTSESVTFTFDIYENQGRNNLEHVTMYFFGGDATDLPHNEIIRNSNAHIMFDTSKSVHVIDPHGYFENAEFSISNIDTWNFELNYDITFAKPMETSSILIRSWDHDRQTADKIFINAIEVVEPSFLDVPNEITSQESFMTQTELVDIPLWVKNNAYWWNQYQISDSDFISGIEYLINQNVIYVSNTETTNSATSDDVPDWVRDVAGFWASDSISDAEFISAIQWMITNGIMVIA